MNFVIRVLAAALIAGGIAAEAQTYTSNVSLPGMTGVTTYNSAPPGFDPVSAPDSALQDYGFPRRPDQSDVKAYSHWLQAVSLTRVTPELTPTNRFHRPNQRIGKAVEASDNTSRLQSGNWSGYSLVGGSPKFDEVVGLWIVPSVNNQFSSINGYMSEWVGIDGNCNCNDLIQDGTEQQFTNGKASYYAWIEFIPENEIVVSNFSVSPGDVIYAYSAVGTKNGVTTGFYYIANYNTRQAVSASLSIPPRTTYSGLSAEWIVERTEVSGSFNNPLPDYAYAYMDNAYAYRSGSTRAIDYTAGTNENITMYQGSTALSKSYTQDADSLWFQWLAY